MAVEQNIQLLTLGEFIVISLSKEKISDSLLSIDNETFEELIDSWYAYVYKNGFCPFCRKNKEKNECKCGWED